MCIYIYIYIYIYIHEGSEAFAAPVASRVVRRVCRGWGLAAELDVEGIVEDCFVLMFPSHVYFFCMFLIFPLF